MIIRDFQARESGILDTLEQVGHRALASRHRGEIKNGSAGRSDLDVSSLFRTAAQITLEGIPETHYLIDGLVPAEALLLVSGIAKGGGKTTWATHGVKAMIEGTTFLSRTTERTPISTI